MPTQEYTLTDYAPLLERVINRLDEPGERVNSDWPSPEFWDGVRKLTPAGRVLLVQKLNAHLEQIRRQEELIDVAEKALAANLRMHAAASDLAKVGVGVVAGWLAGGGLGRQQAPMGPHHP